MSNPDISPRASDNARLAEAGVLSLSTSAVENLTIVSPHSAETHTLSSPRVNQNTIATSPRARQTAIYVSHGTPDNDIGSIRSIETPVELVVRGDDRLLHNSRSNDRGQGQREERNGSSGLVNESVNGYVTRNNETNTSRTRDTDNRRRLEVIDTLGQTRHADGHKERRSFQNNTHIDNNASHARRGHSDGQRRVSETDLQNARRNFDRNSDRRLPQGNVHIDTNADRSRTHRRHSTGSRSVSSGRTRIRSARTISTEEEEKDERYVVPALPMPVAILCCVLNFIIPGVGSMTASVCVLCCAKTEDMTCKEKCGSCCTVFGIGVLQLLLVACFLIGWFWSIIWGITFIGMSANYYHTDEEEDVDLPPWERNLIGRTPLPAPQVVTSQPYPGIGYDDLRREYERRRRHRQEHQRRARSRISLTTSNLIYPMRAPSNMAYNSPPPPYEDSSTELPSYRSLDAMAASREESRRHEQSGHDDRTRTAQLQINDFRPMNSTIQEEDHIT